MEENKKTIPDETVCEAESAGSDTACADKSDLRKRVRKWISRLLTPECITAAFLSVMSIIISVVSLNTDAASSKIAEKELDILTNDREAYFVVEADEERTRLVNDRGTEEFSVRYTIKNEGGRVSGLSVKPTSQLVVLMSY